MSDIRARWTTEAFMHRGFERQKPQYVIDILAHRPSAPGTPRPYRWRNIVDDWDGRIGSMDSPRHSVGEIGAVDDDEHIRSRRNGGLCGLANAAQDRGQSCRNGPETHDRK